MKYRILKVLGELWAAYPVGMQFPRFFSHCYPMRGRGQASRILYVLNKMRIDWIFTTVRKDFELKLVPSLKQDEHVAFFWPAADRSTGRFYGYRVENGVVTEYWKLATNEEEQGALMREAKNVSIARKLAEDVFHVPACFGTETREGVLIARYEALPSNAQAVRMNEEWRGRILAAQRVIADAGYRHGDFGWHNLKAADNELWILDWEEMSDSLPKLVDEISFEAMYRHYNLGVPIDAIGVELREKYVGRMDEVAAAIRSMAERRIAPGALLINALGIMQ